MSGSTRRGSARSGGSSTVTASASKKSVRAAEQDRPDVAAARAAWAQAQAELDPERLVFIDETGTSTNMARLRGRAPRGERLVGKVPHGHWKTTTFVAGLRSSARTAPCVIDGPMNGNAFLAYVEQILGPTLKPGDIVVLDNLSCAQGGGRARSDRSRRCDTALPAALLARLQPDRAALRQAQGLAPKSRRAIRRSLWDRIGAFLTPSPPTNAPTTSAMPDTLQTKWKVL